MADKLHKGDKVSWETSQGRTQGEEVRKKTSSTQIKGHKVAASIDNPEYIGAAKNRRHCRAQAGRLKKPEECGPPRALARGPVARRDPIRSTPGKRSSDPSARSRFQETARSAISGPILYPGGAGEPARLPSRNGEENSPVRPVGISGSGLRTA